MDENELSRTFSSEYKEPVIEPLYDDSWEQSIEIKLSKQGQLLVGLTIGLGVTLVLSTLQGKVVLNLVKGHKMVVDAINSISTIVSSDVPSPHSEVSYTEPSGRVSDTPPVDEEEAEQLRLRLEGTDNEPRFE
jgi:hypothetical protein